MCDPAFPAALSVDAHSHGFYFLGGRYPYCSGTLATDDNGACIGRAVRPRPGSASPGSAGVRSLGYAFWCR